MLGVPVIASRISGLIGTLGDDYPGYFAPQDTKALAEQLSRAETDQTFYQDLTTRCNEATQLLTPEREQQGWEDLLVEIV